MADLTTNISQAISDFNEIKTAIVDKGVNVPDNTPTKEYPEYIRNIQGSGEGSGVNITVNGNIMPSGSTLAFEEISTVEIQEMFKNIE